MCLVAWQRGVEVADETKVTNWTTSRRGGDPGLSRGPDIVTKVLKCGRGRGRVRTTERFEDAVLPA